VGRSFAWPADDLEAIAAQIFEAAADADLYACPYLKYADKRTPGATVERRLLHVDWDGSDEFEAEFMAKADKLGAFVVRSGTGSHYHLYIPLFGPVTSKQHDELLKGLHRYLPPGVDAGKKTTENLLRPPGVKNFKGRARGGEPYRTEWVVRPTDARMDVDSVAAHLGVHLTPEFTTPTPRAKANRSVPAAAPTAPNTVQPIDLAEYPAVAAALDAEGDRSHVTSLIVGACYDAGLLLPAARWVVNQREDLEERVAEMFARDEPRDDVAEMWAKAESARQERKRERQRTDARLGIGQYATATVNGSGNLPTANGKPPRAKLWKAADLKKMEQAKFLAKHRIPYSAVTILVGEEGIGKSLLWVYVVAAVTTGKALPAFGIPERDPADVLLIITEDSWQHDVLPRLTVAGADLSRVSVLCEDDNGSGSPTFPDDMQQILDADPAPAMIVVDAWLDTVPGNLKVKDPQQARLALHPWKEAASQTGAAVLLLTHTNRIDSTNTRDRYGATGALRQKARATLYALADENRSLIVGPEKANGSPTNTNASRFKILAEPYFAPTPDHDGRVPSLMYAGEADPIRQVLADMAADAKEGRRHKTDAEIWLAEYLADGKPHKSVDILNAGKDSEYDLSPQQLKRAKKKLDAEAFAQQGQDGAQCWFWVLTSGDAANTDEAEDA
jgi:hypothetical protein